MATLSEQEIEGRLRELPWSREGGSIVKEWTFASFAAALAFVDSVGAEAEQAGHHPDILLHRWNKVKLTLSTHSEGGLTKADFELARRIEGLA
jgi:4a-hydroxytetrahydrobiopterin dehydratase